MKFLKFVRNAFQNAQNQSGDGVTTRRQTAALQEQQQQQRQQPSETENEIRNENEDAIDESLNAIDESLNTENSTNNEAPEIMEQVQENDEQEIPHDNDLFHKETLIAENDLVEVYIIKDHFKRQKLFKYY